MRLSEQYVKVRYTRGQVCLISNVCWPEKLHVAESGDPAGAVLPEDRLANGKQQSTEVMQPSTAPRP
jgi:hypothetical protein